MSFEARVWDVVSRGETYEILHDREGYAAIRCLRCWLISHNPNDVAQRYCGNCHRFHELG